MNLTKHISQSAIGSLLKKTLPGLALVAACAAMPAQVVAEDAAQVGGSTIYGFLGYCAMDLDPQEQGLYTLSPTGEKTLVWLDQKIGVMGTYVSVMWPEGGMLHALYGNSSKFFHLAFNFADGTPVIEDEINVDNENAYKYIRRGAYNPNDGYIYGFSYNADESQDYFVKAPASNPSNVTIIREMPVSYVPSSSNCFNPEDNCMYGVDSYKSLIKVDVHGNFDYTNLQLDNNTPLFGVVSGMVYSPKDKCFYWNARYTDFSSEYVKIDPNNTVDVPVNGVMEERIKAETVGYFRVWDAFVSFFTFDTTGADNGPVAPETVSVNFPDGALSGSIVYKMPEKLANGSAAPASMTWEATNGVDAPVKGTAAPGAEVKVEYNNLNNENYTFWFRAYAGDAEGEIAVNNLWIGPDVPALPTNVTITPTQNRGKYLVKWTPPTHGAHNAYFNPENVVYAVYLNDELPLATVKGSEAEVEIDDEGEETAYYVAVYAISGELVSEAGYSKTIYLGDGWGLPYTIDPTIEQLSMMTYINPEDDSLGWRPYEYSGTTVFYTGRDFINGGNDWLITPHFYFPDAEVEYEISYDVALYNELIPEDYYEIWLGTEATEEGIMQQRIQAKTKPISQSFKREKKTFTVPEAGTYFIGFRCVSEPEQAGIVLKKITVQQSSKPVIAVEEVAAPEIRVVGEKGQIAVRGAKCADLAIYNLSGTRLFNGNVGMAAAVPMAPGVYIVVADGKTFKVIVK